MQKPSARHAKALVRLGMACARYQAKPDQEQFETIRQAAGELGFQLAPLGDTEPKVPDDAWFAGPAEEARRKCFRIGVLTLALFLLSPEPHEGAAKELRELFDELELAKAGLSRYLDELVADDAGTAFATFTANIDSVLDAALARRGETEAPAIAKLDELETVVGQYGALRAWGDDLVATIGELRICLGNRCAIASLALSGKLMEAALKLILTSQRVSHEDTAPLATLLTLLRQKCPRVELDPDVGEAARLIDRSRIAAIAGKLKPPIPEIAEATPIVLTSAELLRRAVALADAG